MRWSIPEKKYVTLFPSNGDQLKPTTGIRTMKKYKAKDMEFEAVQYTGTNQDEVMAFLDGHSGPGGVSFIMGDDIHFEDPEGTIVGSVGDYIVKTDAGCYLHYKKCFEAFFVEVGE